MVTFYAMCPERKNRHHLIYAEDEINYCLRLYLVDIQSYELRKVTCSFVVQMQLQVSTFN